MKNWRKYLLIIYFHRLKYFAENEVDLVRLNPTGTSAMIMIFRNWHENAMDVGVDTGSRLYARVHGSENPEIYLMMRNRQTGDISCYIDIGSDYIAYDIIPSP